MLFTWQCFPRHFFDPNSFFLRAQTRLRNNPALRIFDVKEQVKGLYDKYEIDMEMFDYVIEPYLTYALNNLPPKYAPKQDTNDQE